MLLGMNYFFTLFYVHFAQFHENIKLRDLVYNGSLNTEKNIINFGYDAGP